jgi:hypothetical protein
MEIKILDNQTVFIKGKKENVLINPSKSILDNSKYQSRIIIFTSGKFDDSKQKFDGVIVRGPGEYEVGGVEIIGYSANNGNSMYVIGQDGLILSVLGEMDEPISDKRIEKINSVDVLLAPVTIKNDTSAKPVLEWAKKWGVNYLIPTGWAEDEKLLDQFLDVADQEGLEKTDMLKVDKDSLPDGLEIKVLKKV